LDLNQLRCFVAVADEFHFGRAAQRLEMLPSSLGRHIKQLEEDLGTRLMARTTRNVALTEDGVMMLEEARSLLAQADSLAARIRSRSRSRATTIRIGTIDSAAAGLIPQLMYDFRERAPHVSVELVEDKTVRILPKLLSGRLDLAFVRPRANPGRRLEFLFLLYETVVVALSEGHPLASRDSLVVAELEDQPLILPDRKSRPHSHDLTMKLFAEEGLEAKIAQHAEEKQTIVNLVAAGIGAAIVPKWTSKMATRGVRFVPLLPSGGEGSRCLPLAATWVRGSRDGVRDDLLDMVREKLATYSAGS
jgi:DNA-binding transcriptional LysR family regulator